MNRGCVVLGAWLGTGLMVAPTIGKTIFDCSQPAGINSLCKEPFAWADQSRMASSATSIMDTLDEAGRPRLIYQTT